MEKFPMCRICLVKGVRMYVVINKNLHELYEKLTDVPFVTEDSRPMLACFFCCAKLKQCWRFQRKCLEAEELFAQMLNEDYEPDPLISQGQLSFYNGFVKSPTENINIVGVCQIESVVVKKELPEVCGEVDVNIEPKQEYKSAEIKLEFVDNSYPAINDTVHHTEQVSEYEVSFTEVKIEVEDKEESTVSEMSEDITQRNAQYCKKYYSRKKSANQGVVKKKANSEKCRQYRQRKKLLAQQLQSKNEVIHTPSTSLQMTFEPQLITTEPELENVDYSYPDVEDTPALHAESDSDDIPLMEVKNEVDELIGGAPVVKNLKPDPRGAKLGYTIAADQKNTETNRKLLGVSKIIKETQHGGCGSMNSNRDEKNNETSNKSIDSDDKKRERIERIKERNREYQRAYRQRKNALKKKVSKEEKEEARRKRHRENQRAYYQRTKLLKNNDKNVEELFQNNLDDLQIKREKLDSNEDQEDVVQCRASQNFENVQFVQNQFLTQQLRIYEESQECITPKDILHRITDIPGDGNCLFHSLTRVLQLQISTCDLRRQLRDSSYLNSCHNPQLTYNILSSNNEYGDLDCLYLFAKIYNQNICVHYHYFNVISKNEDTRFCHFNANGSSNWIHLDLREQHFTPYITDEEKKKEDERKQKEKNKEYSKRYRDKKRTSLLTGPSAREVLDLQPVVHTSEIPGPSTGGVPYVLPVIYSSQIADLSSRNVPSCLSIHSTEDRVRQRHFPSQVVASSPLNIDLQTYSAFQQNSSAHRQFEKDFFENDFGHACDICDRLWFRKDLKYLQNNDATPNIEFIRTLLTNVAILKINICSTCFIAIQKQNIPPLSVYNGFKYPPLPDCLKNCPLDLLTERFISPRIPFMQIRRLRHFPGRYRIYGQVINVPNEVNTMVHRLPREADDDHAITVHIKRRKIHKSSHVYGIVAKRKIKVWLRYLKDTPLYKSYGVLVDDGFLNDRSYDVKDEIVFDDDGDNDILEQVPIEESLMAQQQTLLWNDEMYLKIAPGEGNTPKSLLFDEHAEELSFPQIYLGQFREFRHVVTPFMMATSEIRRSDRRGVTPEHLFYMAMKIMRIRIKESLHIAYKQSQDIAITKDQIQSDDYILDSIETNLAFLRSIPNSAYYWSERKKDLFAMIRQYGKPTVFFSISANEIGWPKLLQLLYNLKNNAEITVEEAADLHFIEKSSLINEDAVTCAIYFNKLVESLLKILQSKRHSPFRKYRVLHYFKRIEFQHRGSAHAHILAWLDNAPEDAVSRDYNQAIDLIDFLISVSAAEASGDIQLQTHKHTFTCYKGASRQQKCRFDAPFMPAKKTMILTPMPDTENGFQLYKAKYYSIQRNLEKYEYNGFQSFYDENDIASDDEYVKIIRAGINRPRVFPKRELCEKWNNPFNPFILNVARSNTDFQFITDEHSCAAYVVEYVNKTNRGVSNLQRQIIEIMDEHPEFNLFDLTKNISIKLLNHTELTSQEAAWYLLREPVSKSSSVIAYIPTIRPLERHRKKTMKELNELEDDSSEKENWFEKYEKRPEDLSSISLAQFVAKYYKNYKGDYVLREEPRVIRYRNYDMSTDYNEYRREMVTLHLPFRHEESEILAESRYLQLYEENEAFILDRRKEFESNVDIEKTLEICRELCRKHVSDDGR